MGNVSKTVGSVENENAVLETFETSTRSIKEIVGDGTTYF